jgi:hypothetical protein
MLRVHQNNAAPCDSATLVFNVTVGLGPLKLKPHQGYFYTEPMLEPEPHELETALQFTVVNNCLFAVFPLYLDELDAYMIIYKYPKFTKNQLTLLCRDANRICLATDGFIRYYTLFVFYCSTIM